MKKMGEAGLHPFVEGFRQIGISKFSQLKSKPVSDVRKLGAQINMPDAAVDRLLEVLGKKKKEEVKITQTKIKQVATSSAPPPKKIEKPADSPKPLAKDAETGKATDSGYYHFSSTPQDMARRFDAKKVDNVSNVEWKTAYGASSWNPGNTVEERDFSSKAQSMLKSALEGYVLCETIKVSKVKKTGGDFTVISNRGKIKCIYDMNFSVEWVGTIADEKVSGKLEVEDVQPDDDDWYINITYKTKNDFHKIAKQMISKGLVERLNRDVFHEMMNLLRPKVG